MTEYIIFPNNLASFNNTKSTEVLSTKDKPMHIIDGYLDDSRDSMVCPICRHNHFHIHNAKEGRTTKLRHLPLGDIPSIVRFPSARYLCTFCGTAATQNVPFKAEDHYITKQLEAWCKVLLWQGNTLKRVSELTGLHQGIVKDIDKKRLENLYCKADGTLRPPEKQSAYIAIDEFLLHKGHRYAIAVLDLETGDALYCAPGKKKQQVYDFIEFVGLEWMSGVKAVACDMNADFAQAFLEKCPHLDIVHDYYHQVQNFNTGVLTAIRRDEYARLMGEGKKEEAETLKKTRWVITSSRETLRKKDAASQNEGEKQKYECESQGGPVPQDPSPKRPTKEERLDAVLSANKDLAFAYILLEKYKLCFEKESEEDMSIALADWLDLANCSDNKRIQWFVNLVVSHFQAIANHGKHRISTGRLEGINNVIKTIRRQAYGFGDDNYFFLKIMDATRKKYYKLSSHKIPH